MRTRQCNETSSSMNKSSEMDNNMIAANEIAMKKVVAMKIDDGKDIAREKAVAMKIDDGKDVAVENNETNKSMNMTNMEMIVNSETNKGMNMTNMGMKKMAMNSETNKSMNMMNMDMKKMEWKNNNMNSGT